MTNKPRAIGTRAETLVVAWVKANGFPHAERIAQHGSYDQGDIRLTPDLIVEVKARKTWTPSDIQDWLDQTEYEAVNNGPSCEGVLILKRPGTLDVGRWWAVRSLDVYGRNVTQWMSVSDYWWMRGWSN